MRKLISSLFFIAFFSSTFSQVTFDKGYFINNNGERTECLIKNLDWEENPEKVTYMLSDLVEQEITLENTQEFGVYEWSKYVKKTVKIDKSKIANLDDLTYGRSPEFVEETIFLNEIVEGFAKLYVYDKNNIQWFFISIDTNQITQLVHKKYYVNKDNEHKLATNNFFKNQLSYYFKCSDISSKRIESLRYIKNDLTQLFVNYNQCIGQGFRVIKEDKKVEGDVFNLSPRLGISRTFFSIENDRPGVLDAKFGAQNRFRFGIEFEFILPYNRNKWAFIIEPTYLSAYENQKQGRLGPAGGNREITSRVHLNTYEVPFGLRYYFFLNNDWRIYINATNTIELTRKKEIVHYPFSRNRTYMPDSPTMNLSFGAGIKLADRFSLEVRHTRYRDIFESERDWHYLHRSTFFIVGYNIF